MPLCTLVFALEVSDRRCFVAGGDGQMFPRALQKPSDFVKEFGDKSGFIANMLKKKSIHFSRKICQNMKRKAFTWE